MPITSFRLKYLLNEIICGIYRAADVGRIHPARERSLRALHKALTTSNGLMPDAMGFDSPRQLIEYALRQSLPSAGTISSSAFSPAARSGSSLVTSASELFTASTASVGCSKKGLPTSTPKLTSATVAARAE